MSPLELKKVKTSYAKDLKRFKKSQYNSNLQRLENKHFILHPEIDKYLLNLKEHIADHNPAFDFDELEILITRYNWPNAFSVGDGTLAINLGLIRKLENEAQLAFVICHESAHYFLEHTDQDFIRKHQKRNSEEFKNQIREIESSQYYKSTKIKSLIKNNLYSERSHNRRFEYQADSLGMVLFTKAGYTKNDAIEVLNILDQLNEPADYSIPFFELLKIDTLRYSKASLVIHDKHKEDVLHDDSIKTHPDCQGKNSCN